MLIAFALRAAGLLFDLVLPAYRARPGRDYTDAKTLRESPKK